VVGTALVWSENGVAWYIHFGGEVVLCLRFDALEKMSESVEIRGSTSTYSNSSCLVGRNVSPF
jgi:hypothetical protein